MKRISLLIFFLLWRLYVAQGQTLTPTWGCGADVVRMPNGMITTQDVLQIKFDKDWAEYIKSGKHLTNTRQVYTIPTVVHIIHDNGASNITDAQVFQAIQELNDGFRNAGDYAFPLGVDTEIDFCLAQRDPQGQGTNGINRIFSSLTDMTIETEDLALKALLTWDPTQYLNVWVVNSITSAAMGPGVAGYAYLPSSHGLPHDGIVIEAAYFGTGTHPSKVMLHEAGHYLGLYHPFEGGCPNNDCLVDGDKVCDTPPDATNTWVQCTDVVNSCQTDADDLSANNPFRPVANGGIGDQPDMFQNYMDYSQPICANRFSAMQKDRMVFSLLGARESLLHSDGCNSPCNPVITTQFTASATNILINQSATFTNTSLNGSAYQWLVNGVNISNATDFTHTFTQLGTYIIRLEGTTSQPGCADFFEDTLTVSCGAQANFTSTDLQIPTGGSVTFTATPTAATNYSWMVGGVFSGSGLTFTYSPTASMSLVSLIVSNNECADTSTLAYVQMGSCSWRFNNIWFFGDSVGLDFFNSPPTKLSGFHIYTNEPSTTFCDRAGNLMFYSEGVQVRDKNKNLMPNGVGLSSHVSARDGVMAYPYPGQPNKYLLVTRDALETAGAAGIKYNVIDMTLNGGLGDVTLKNQTVKAPATGEGMCGVYDMSSQTGWLIFPDLGTPQVYRVHKVDASGIQTTATFTLPLTAAMPGNGFLRLSHDGKKLAMYCYISGAASITLLDFDLLTGVLSNPVNFAIAAPGMGGFYGSEFSPNNQFLYIGIGGGVYQYDISSNVGATISATGVGVASGGFQIGGFQKGIDDKVYFSDLYSDKVGCINQPNLAGAACSPSVIDMQGSQSIIGLPTYVRLLNLGAQVHINGAQTLCQNSESTYLIAGNLPNDTTTYTASSNISILQAYHDSVRIRVNEIGAGYVVVKNFAACGLITDTIFLTITPPLPISLGNDTVFCGNSIMLTPTPIIPGANYVWSNGITTPTATLLNDGQYWVEVSNAQGCNNRDTISIQSSTYNNNISLGSDKTICEGEVVVLSVGNNYLTYNWLNTWSEPTYTAYQPGTYWVTVTGVCGMSDTDSITLFPAAKIIPMRDTFMCAGVPITLTATGAGTFVWSNGTANATAQIKHPGTYIITMTSVEGCISKDTVNVVRAPQPVIQLGKDKEICKGDAISLSTGISNGQYLWSNGSTTPYITVQNTGWYAVEVTEQCTAKDSVFVQEIDCCSIFAPNSFSPNSDNINDRFEIKASCPLQFFSLTIFDRWGRLVYESHDITQPWDATFQGESVPEGVYIFQLHSILFENGKEKEWKRTGDVTVIR